MQHITEDGGVMVVPEDPNLPDFKGTIRFEPRELNKWFEASGACSGGGLGARGHRPWQELPGHGWP